MVATVLLIATLFWALWDESYGQRPWKDFQANWKDRYSAFLKTDRSKSVASEKDVESSPDYLALKQAFEQANAQALPEAKAINEKLRDVNGRLLAVRSVFTDRRAYVNALTYEFETDTSSSGKASKQKEIDKYKSEPATVVFPDGSRKQYKFNELEEAFTELNGEKTALSLQLGQVLKPVSEAKKNMDAYVADHLVDLPPKAIDGLVEKTTNLEPSIQQINVADANIVDRCESCHMGIREPLHLTADSMSAK